MIFIERNDPNQISNLIDYQTGESKLNYSSGVSEVSENGNDSKLYENSFDKPHYRSVDSQISEYAVQKSVMEYTDFKSKSEYESGNSVLNNLQFTSKNREEEFFSNKKEGYINSLWRKGNDQNKDSQVLNTISKKNLFNQLNKFQENNSDNKINLSCMLSNNSVNRGENNDYKDMVNRDTNKSDAISYLCSNNESNLDFGIGTEDFSKLKMNKYKINTSSNNSKFNVMSNNAQSDNNTNTNQSNLNNISINDKKISKITTTSVDDLRGKK